MSKNSVGKDKKWKAYRRQWFINNPPNWEGFYECYLCGKWNYPKETTLDHVIPRSNTPNLSFDESNIKPACWSCNTLKGSQSVENYKKSLK